MIRLQNDNILKVNEKTGDIVEVVEGAGGAVIERQKIFLEGIEWTDMLRFITSKKVYDARDINELKRKDNPG
jgi:hypothetical protein